MASRSSSSASRSTSTRRCSAPIRPARSPSRRKPPRPSGALSILNTVGSITLYPAQSAVAWSKTVKASGGGDYTTLSAAFAALNAAAPESAEIVVGETGSYELGQATSYYGGHRGYVTVRASTGVTATLIRGASFDALNTLTSNVLAWEWWPWNGAVEFQGSGIVLDMHNWNHVNSNDNNPHWFNGCTLTNSAGARDATYWNNAPPNALSCTGSSGGPLGAYFTDGTSTWVDLCDALLMMTNWSARGQLTGDHSNCPFMVGNYETETDCELFHAPRNAISVYYTGPGTARIVTTLVSTNADTLDCQVDTGSGFASVAGFPITLFNNPGSGGTLVFTMNDVRDRINAIAGGGWHATTVDNTLACWTLAQQGGPTTTYSPISTNSLSPTNLRAMIGYHTEWIHYRETTPVYNFILRDNVIRSSAFSSAPISLAGANNSYNGVIRNNVFEMNSDSNHAPATVGLGIGNHLSFTGNYYNAAMPIWDLGAYSKVSQNVFEAVTLGTGSVFPTTSTVYENNAAGGSWPSGTPVSNTGSISFSGVVTDKTGGDFRPTGSMPTAVRIDDYDGRNAARAATDAIGPWASGGSAPAYPF
jgi:hypothetical protein